MFVQEVRKVRNNGGIRVGVCQLFCKGPNSVLYVCCNYSTLTCEKAAIDDDT